MSSKVFSRPSRAGLIEASPPTTTSRLPRCFPALHGRASLKPAGVDMAGVREALSFPALHGRASLKPSRPPARRRRPGVFPPFTGGPH